MPRAAKDGMNKKQREFARRYHETGKATQSAIDAGYSENSAHVQCSRLLAHEGVIAELGRLQAQTAIRHNITVDKLVEMSLAVHDSAMEGQVMLDRYGNPTSTTKRDHSAANKAIENIARMTGHLVEKRDVTVKSINDMSEEELKAELARTKEEIAKAEGNDIKDLGSPNNVTDAITSAVKH